MTNETTKSAPRTADDLPLIDRAIELVNDRGSASGEMLRRALEISLVDAERYIERLVIDGVLQANDMSGGPRYLATGSRTHSCRMASESIKTSTAKPPTKSTKDSVTQEARSGPSIPPVPQPTRANIEAEAPGKEGMQIQDVPIEQITVDPTIQPRTEIDAEVVERYREIYEAGNPMPPLRLYRVDGRLVLAAGHHRLNAARRAGLTKLNCEISDGELRDALLWAIASNAEHGLNWSRQDRRRVVEMLLDDPEWSQQSGRAIGRFAGVSDKLVGTIRREMMPEKEVDAICDKVADADDVRIVTRGGQQFEMKTSGIGRKPDGQTASDTAEDASAPKTQIDLRKTLDSLDASLQSLRSELKNGGKLSEELEQQLDRRIRSLVQVITKVQTARKKASESPA